MSNKGLYQEFRTIRWKSAGGIGMLMLDQPPSNVMTLEFFHEFSLWVRAAAKEPGLTAIVIQGNGRHFSSGADLDELLTGIDGQAMIENYASFSMVEKLGVPVICAIRGVCLGSALELALFCDYRICGEEAVLGLPESTFNLMPGVGGIHRFASIAGKSEAIGMILRGSTFSATDALKMGLVDVLVPGKEVIPAAIRLAGERPAKMEGGLKKAYLDKIMKTSHGSGKK